LFGLLGFGGAFINGCSAFMATWPSDYSVKIHVLFRAVPCPETMPFLFQKNNSCLISIFHRFSLWYVISSLHFSG
jgi:hypothetical protein